MDRFNNLQSGSMPFFTEDGAFCPAAVYSTLAGTFCCHEDDLFSLEDGGTGLTALLGYTADEIGDRFCGQLSQMIPPEDRQEFFQKAARQLASGDTMQMACRFYHKEDAFLWTMVKARRVVHPSGSTRICGMIADISRYKSMHDDLYRKLDQLNIILAQTENIIFEWDLSNDSIFFSDTWESIFGYAPITHEFGKSVSAALSHLHPDDVPLLLNHLHVLKGGVGYQAIDARIARADGVYLWCRLRATAIRDSEGQVTKLVGIIINIDAEKREASALKKQAERDSLTKLLNKQTAHEKVVQYLASDPDGVNCVLMIIDVDHFKQVNDQYGHMVGDSVLTQCAREIKRLFRPVDIVARIGGDEFLVLMKDTADRELVKARCDQLIAAFRSILQPYLQANTLSCSIGAAFAPEHGTAYYDLFVAADRALYHAKGLGKNQYTFYSSDIASLPTQQFASAVNTQIDSNDYPELWSD
ncbi:MAG: diguanylate cyclase [Clostridia bacterium]|nr:diguanylate cyclase [Clostridia bacterium]